MDTPTRSRMALSANISNTASHLAGKKTGSRWSPLPMTNASDYLLCSSLSLLLSCDRSIHEWQSFPAERRRREASLPRLCKCLISLYPSVPSDDASQTMRLCRRIGNCSTWTHQLALVWRCLPTSPTRLRILPGRRREAAGQLEWTVLFHSLQ